MPPIRLVPVWVSATICAALLCLACTCRPATATAATAAASVTEAHARLSFIEALYAERDDFRCETEVLAYLHETEGDATAAGPRALAELVRAKLYARAGRWAEAEVMLISLVDRVPRGETAEAARRLLGFAWLRQGRLAEAAPLLAGEPPLDALRAVPPYDAGRAVAWSTGLPGAGFFTLGEPARAATALSVNLLFLAGTVIAYQQHNVPAALIFAAVEAAFYRGGREAVRDEAARLNERWLAGRREAWLAGSSEPRLLGAAFEVKF